MARLPLTLAGPLLALLAGTPAPPDVVHLEDGSKVEGRVLFENGRRVVVRVGSRTLDLERREVDSIESVEANLRELLRLQDAVPDETPELWGDLARFASGKGLEGLDRLAWLRALLLAPEDEAACEALGVRGKPGKSKLELDGHEVPLARLGECTSWRKRRTLRTPHYAIETNLGLGQAIDAALDLERFYLFFHELVGREIGIFQLEEPARVQIHADAESFPLAAANDRDAWFDPSGDTLYVRSLLGVNRHLLYHEATHQLVEHGFRRGTSTGDIPVWADEGLAEYLAMAGHGPPGRAAFDPGRRHDIHFLTHGEGGEDVLGLREVLNLGRGAFLSGGEVDRAYAQSYTLVHFLMEDRRTALRERFLQFLESAREGRGGPSRFLDMLGLDEDRLEATWHDYARRIASGR